MEIKTNIPLKELTTMKIGGNTRYMTEVHTAEEVADVCRKAEPQSLKIFVIGDGSNIIAKDEGFDGLVVRVCIPGFEIISDDDNSTTIRIGAGENWDSVVERTVKMNLSGIEAMSGIPGTAGATPIQNVGAYGQEIADTLQSLEAFDIIADKFVTMQNIDCEFTYRQSVFKGKSAGRYIVTSITLRLNKIQIQAPLYDSLQKHFNKSEIGTFTPAIIRDAVLEIRKNKLPNPKILPNSGSFFENVIVSRKKLDNLKIKNPNIPSYDLGDNRHKIPAGWLIEQTGLKGKLIQGMRVYDKNAIILVNESANSYRELKKAQKEIVDTVYKKFGIKLEQEPIEM